MEKPIEPDDIIRKLCHENGLSIIPDSGGYRCGPVDNKGRFAWYVYAQTRQQALHLAIINLEAE